MSSPSNDSGRARPDAPAVHVRRVHDQPEGQDGGRVLIGRRLPRGPARNRAGIDERLRETAPSGRGPLSLLTATRRPEISAAAVLAGLNREPQR